MDNDTYERATEAGRQERERQPLAISARYVSGRIYIELNNGCAFMFPVDQAQGLAGAKAADLRRIEIDGGGTGLHWPLLDADLYVPQILRGVLGSKRWMAELGAAGGKSTSDKKVVAARANGRLGGRPRKADSAA